MRRFDRLWNGLDPNVQVFDLPDALRENILQLRTNQRRSEEHTSELQSRRDLVCRLLLEKKKIMKQFIYRNAGILLSIFMVVFASSCSGNDDSNPFGEEASFSMKFNGENWSSSITNLFTEKEYNNGEVYYFVYITRSQIMDMENPTGNDTTESMAIYIAIPFSKAQIFFFNDTATTEIYTLSLHDALPI